VSLEEWNQRYGKGEQLFDTPSPLVERFTGTLALGDALDLASGPGRHALYLAARGWRVTAVDGSTSAIDALRARAKQRKLHIDACVADLERGQFQISPNAYDLICDCYYLERSLIPQMKEGLRPGGLLIAIVHLADLDQPQGTPTRAIPGELRGYFPDDWTILHYYEGKPHESCHQRPVAELVVRKPSP
jgi:SAM-dependent methyltransferase